MNRPFVTGHRMKLLQPQVTSRDQFRVAFRTSIAKGARHDGQISRQRIEQLAQMRNDQRLVIKVRGLYHIQ